MILERLQGILRPKAPETPIQITDEEIKAWGDSYLHKSFQYQDVYAALIALRNNPSRKVYASLVVDLMSDYDRDYLDIPLMDHTPEEQLAEKAYQTTFFGEVEPLKYSIFAMNEFNKNPLLALLNRKTANVTPDEVPGWFYRTFDVEHLEPYGTVFIGSHGGLSTYGYDYNATIRRRMAVNNPEDNSLISAIKFSKEVETSLPHLSVKPLPVEPYLKDIQNGLKFLPKDWDIK